MPAIEALQHCNRYSTVAGAARSYTHDSHAAGEKPPAKAAHIAFL